MRRADGFAGGNTSRGNGKPDQIDEWWLRQRVADCLRLPVEEVSPRVPLFEYGLDSLAVGELTAAIDARFGIPDASTLLIDECDIESILRGVRGTVGEPGRPDTRLPADVIPVPSAHRVRPRAVLLTGASGFVGSHILRRLLRDTRLDVHCLVRGGSRIEELDSRGPDETHRIHVVTGDLCKRGFGLTPDAYARLARAVDVVVHCGAIVDWVTPYRGLRATNVEGTIEVLRFACHRAARPVHFLSSLSVCYAKGSCGGEGERFEWSEGSDSLEHFDGLYLGYAQSKAVAESMVRQANSRGLPAVIHRPGLVTGHSETGDSNLEDITALLVRGCISMGTAPDLDLLLDGCPVDVIAKQVVDIGFGASPGTRNGECPVFHWADRSKRNWREIVLWMNLYGHRVRLVPFGQWQDELASGAVDETHPLFRLRPFFLDRRSGLTNAEHFERHRRSPVRVSSTVRWLGRSGQRMPCLGPDLLERYFQSYEERGFLPSAPGRTRENGRDLSGAPSDRALVAELLGCPPSEVEYVGPVEGDSILSDLTAWHGATPSGLHRFRLRSGRTIVLKRKGADDALLDVGRCVAEMCRPGLGDRFVRHAHCLGLLGAARREVDVYGTRDARFRRLTPEVLGSRVDGERGGAAIVMEDLSASGVRILDAADPRPWPREQLESALEDLAQLHTIWLSRVEEAESAVAGPFADAAAMARAAPLWEGLHAHASCYLNEWLGTELVAEVSKWGECVEAWWRELARMPRTLIHGDFNSRNIAVRFDHGRGPRLCAFDWELARPAVPQRDLVELLCFALADRSPEDEISHFVSYYRSSLERASGVSLALADWRRGFDLALRDMAICRLPLYCLVHRIRPQPYLARVSRVFRRLAEARITGDE